jgi:hypothetical protein
MQSRFWIVALLAGMMFSGVALGEEAGPYTWVNFLKARPGMSDELTKLLTTEEAKILDPLVDSDVALEWGVAMPIIHDGGDPSSHVEWVTFKNWAGVDAFMQAFLAAQGAKSDDEKKADMKAWQSMVVPGSHADSVHKLVDSGAGSGARPAYIMVSYYQAKRGKFSEAMRVWRETTKPIYDELLAAGKVVNYGLFVPEIHRGEKWTHLGWYSAPNLASQDLVSQAFEAARAARSQEENTSLMRTYIEAFEPEGHSDQILAVVHYYNGTEN